MGDDKSVKTISMLVSSWIVEDQVMHKTVQYMYTDQTSANNRTLECKSVRMC